MSMSRDTDSPPPFLIGANLPWVHYGIDFGANAWRPDGGIGQPEERAQLEVVFAELAASGVRCVRWFLFCDGRAGIRFSARRPPARARRLRVQGCRRGPRDRGPATASESCSCCSIFSGAILRAPRAACRWADARTCSPTPESRDALLDLVLRPLLERYGEEPTILAWDIINEPEWIKTVDAAELHAWLSDSIALIHSATQSSGDHRLCRRALARSICRPRSRFLSGSLVRQLEAPAIAGDAGR